MNKYVLGKNRMKKFDNLIWFKYIDYLIGVDHVYNMYIYTPKDNFFLSKNSDFIFDHSNKIYLIHEQHIYLNNLRANQLVTFNSLTLMKNYINRLKNIDIILSDKI